MAPNFLPDRQYSMGDLFQAGVFTVNGASGSLTSLPGYVNLLQTSRLFLYNSRFVDLQSFSGLRCPPNSLTIYRSFKLISLEGFENVLPAPNLVSVSIYDNPVLKPAGAFAPLASLLGCKSTGADSTGLSSIKNVFVDVAGCPQPIRGVDKLCQFVTSPPDTSCPPNDPPPPPP